MKFRMEDIIKQQGCQMLSVAGCGARITGCGFIALLNAPAPSPFQSFSLKNLTG